MNSLKIIEFLQKAGNLKNTLRFKENERMPKDTTAGHSWRTALMSFIMADELELDLDINKILKMAIVHDIVEAETGNTDYVAIAIGKISEEAQKEIERRAIVQLTQSLPEKTGKEIFNLWTEFDEGKTKESKYVKAINRLETLIYILEVGYTCYSKPELIFNYIEDANEIPELETIFEEVKKQLEQEVAKIRQD